MFDRRIPVYKSIIEVFPEQSRKHIRADFPRQIFKIDERIRKNYFCGIFKPVFFQPDIFAGYTRAKMTARRKTAYAVIAHIDVQVVRAICDKPDRRGKIFHRLRQKPRYKTFGRCRAITQTKTIVPVFRKNRRNGKAFRKIAHRAVRSARSDKRRFSFFVFRREKDEFNFAFILVAFDFFLAVNGNNLSAAGKSVANAENSRKHIGIAPRRLHFLVKLFQRKFARFAEKEIFSARDKAIFYFRKRFVVIKVVKSRVFVYHSSPPKT